MENFTSGNADNADDFDDFQELLDGIALSPVVRGKRGGGRKATNNIGADILGIATLQELRKNHHVNLQNPANLKGNTLWGVIDQNSFNLATQNSMGIESSYKQQGVLAVSLTKSDGGKIVLQWWKATIINDILQFRKVFKSGEQYHLCKNPQGNYGLWKIDASTGTPVVNGSGSYTSFNLNTLVSFEEYLNAIVMATEVPVSFPNDEVSKLQGLSEILASVNLNHEVPDNSTTELDNELDEVEE